MNKHQLLNQKLIKYYPRMRFLRSIFFTYKDLLKMLEEQDIKIPTTHKEAFLSAFFLRMEKNKLNLNFTKYKLILYLDDDISKYISKLLPLDVGLYATYSNTIIEDRYIVTKDNIMSMPTLKGAIIAKWLLRIYDISDVAFITIYKDSYIKTNNKIPSVSDESMAFIENISEKIIPFFEKLESDLKNKFMGLQ